MINKYPQPRWPFAKKLLGVTVTKPTPQPRAPYLDKFFQKGGPKQSKLVWIDFQQRKKAA